MNFSNRRGSSRPSGRLRPRRSVGTRGGCGEGWGPGACPREWRFRQGFMLIRWIIAPGRGQAPGPLLHPTSPLVPTGRLTSLAAFGHQHSLGPDLAVDEELSSAFEPCLNLIIGLCRLFRYPHEIRNLHHPPIAGTKCSPIRTANMTNARIAI